MSWTFEMIVDGEVYGPVTVELDEVSTKGGRMPKAIDASLVAVEKLRQIHGDDFASTGAHTIRPV